MSLHDLANQVQSAGRGDDKVLVHMTPGEVKGLQSIAMAHGGSLTINPETGLPEAGFLKSILPMIAGFGLSMIPGVGPLMAASIVGGGTAVATGDLKKGLMAGLGAYGGAGLGSGLMAQGAGTAAKTATGTVANTPAMNVANTGVEGMKANLYGPNQGIFSTTSNASYIPTNPGFSAASTSQFPKVAAYNANPNMPSFTPAQINLTDMPKQALVGVNQPLSTAATVNPAEIIAPRSGFGQLAEGAKTSFSSTEGLKGLYDAMPTGSVVASGLSLAEAMKPEYKKPEETKSLIRPYEFSYNPTDVSGEPYAGSAERTYFNPVFTAKTPYEAPGPEYAAEGGLMGFAMGGPVEQMAAMNAVGANTRYPMADINTALYSDPMVQRPEATNVIAPSAGAGVGAYSGEQRFAKGGATVEPQTRSSGYAYSFDPMTQQFTQTGGPSTAKPPSPEIAVFDMLNRLNKTKATGQAYDFTPSWAQGASTPTNIVSGGMAQPTSPAQPFVPNINIPAYQTPEQQLGLGGFYDYMNQQLGGYAGYAAGGGVSHLGDYSDGGRLLEGPGDGVSDSIPASIGNRQPARLADGEFVVPARIVSEIGNGSTKAGARKLYAMMDRVQKARRKTVGKGQVARNTKADKLLPA